MSQWIPLVQQMYANHNVKNKFERLNIQKKKKKILYSINILISKPSVKGKGSK
jgi:hypothetical protein